jgi:hypothetical protein
VRNRGVFTLSLDFELIWGTRDIAGLTFAPQCEIERAVVIDRLLDLLHRYEVRATWCTLGHLFLHSCTHEVGGKHPDIVRPAHAWCDGDWFETDPCSDEASDGIWYARSLIQRIRQCPTAQEIGSHTFSHVIFGDPGCSREAARSELQKCVEVARDFDPDLDLVSLAFPRNAVGHLDVVRDVGFRCYRGPEPHWYARPRVPPALRRAAHLFDVLLARTPPVVEVVERLPGLWDIPGSMIFFPSHGLRGHLPMAQRVRRARRGLRRAAHERRIFHLWLHPTNLVDDMEGMFAGLEAVLRDAAQRRSAGTLDIASMASLLPAPGRGGP